MTTTRARASRKRSTTSSIARRARLTASFAIARASGAVDMVNANRRRRAAKSAVTSRSRRDCVARFAR
jgi:hypothetical protein